jgi:hypothetical protein
MGRIAACVLPAVLACAAGTAGAGVIASVPVTFSELYVSGPPMPTAIVLALGARPAQPPPPQPAPWPLPNAVLEQYQVTTTDVGKSFAVTAATDPEFAGFVDLLKTPGAEIYRGFSIESSVGASTGSNGFTLGPASLFAGYDITSIGYRLDSLTIADGVTPYPDFPQFHGRQFAGQVTFVVEGTPAAEVPEPVSAAGVAAVGLAGVALRRGRRSRRV